MSSARDIPHFDEAMAILKPVAERVYELLEQAAPNLDDHNHESFNQSVYAALKVLHRSLDVDTVSAHSDLPAVVVLIYWTQNLRNFEGVSLQPLRLGFCRCPVA